MNILMIVHGYVPQGTGGVELRASYLARVLKNKHNVQVFCGGSDPQLDDYVVEDLVLDGVPVRRVNYNFKDLRSFRGVYINQRIHREAERILDEFKPDVVHIHHLSGLSTTIPEAVRRRNIAQVMTLHDFWMGCPRGKRIQTNETICWTIDRNACLPCTEKIWGGMVRGQSRLQNFLGIGDPLINLQRYDEHNRHVLDLPDLLLTPSESTRERFIEYGIDPSRIRSLPYGLDHGLFKGIRREPSDTLRFGFLGSVIPSKGAHLLVDAFAGLDRKNASLDLFGEIIPDHGDTSYTERLRTAIEGTPGVRIHGRYENREISEILAKVDVLVVPSVWLETYCITIREGFLAGIPVIASDIGAMKEAIIDGESGLLFKTGDVSDLRLKMRRVVDEPELRATMRGQAARVKDLRKNCRELVEIYRATRDKRRSIMSPNKPKKARSE